MNKKIAIVASSVMLLALPLATMAFNAGPTPNSVQLSVQQIIDIVLNFIWPIFGGFAVIMFLIAGFLFLTSQGDPAKVATARQAVLWGVVGVVVGLIAFSIPLIVRVTLGNGI
ncbi:hypothetical protein KW786_01535 [Candidatus Parcubacteria bacterium]|nr:hypothetical protein [Candidatus Parcubacteria bacterium]